MRLAAALLLGTALPAAAAATDNGVVTLRMKGGSFEVNGELRSFDGARYVIDAKPHGTMSLDATRFDCLGQACTKRSAALAVPAERLVPGRPDTFAMHGTPETMQRLLPDLVRGYAQSLGATATRIVGTINSAEARFRLTDGRGALVAEITLAQQDTLAAWRAMEGGAVPIAAVDRALADADAAEVPGVAARMRTPQSQLPLAGDGLAVIVAPGNPATSLSLEVIAKIFAGQTTDWGELGQAAGPIKVLMGPPSGSAAVAFTRTVLEPRKLTPSDRIERFASEQALADQVAREPGGIGLASLAAVGNARALTLEDGCGLVLRPSMFAVKTGEYPLSRRHFLYLSPTGTNPAARGLARYAVSAEAQRIIAANDMVNTEIEALAFAEHAPRLAHAINAPAPQYDVEQMRQLLGDLKDARRLSSTFRFNDEIDAATRLGAARLAERLLAKDLEGRRILLLGFTDSSGRFAANLTRAQKRAGQLRVALLAAAGPKLDQRLIVAKGYGPLAPVTCNDTAEGQRLNRRVEVWVKE